MKLSKTLFASKLLVVMVLFPILITAQPKDVNTNTEIVKGLYDLFGRGDVSAVLNGMDASIVWNEAENFPYADGNPYVGPNAVLEGVFKRLGSEWEYYNLGDLEFYPVTTGDVIVTGRYNAKYKKNGNVMNAQFVHIWRLENGKVVQFQQYADTYKVMRAITSADNDPHH